MSVGGTEGAHLGGTYGRRIHADPASYASGRADVRAGWHTDSAQRGRDANADAAAGRTGAGQYLFRAAPPLPRARRHGRSAQGGVRRDPRSAPYRRAQRSPTRDAVPQCHARQSVRLHGRGAGHRPADRHGDLRLRGVRLVDRRQRRWDGGLGRRRVPAAAGSGAESGGGQTAERPDRATGSGGFGEDARDRRERTPFAHDPAPGQCRANPLPGGRSGDRRAGEAVLHHGRPATGLVRRCRGTAAVRQGFLHRGRQLGSRRATFRPRYARCRRLAADHRRPGPGPSRHADARNRPACRRRQSRRAGGGGGRGRPFRRTRPGRHRPHAARRCAARSGRQFFAERAGEGGGQSAGPR